VPGGRSAVRVDGLSDFRKAMKVLGGSALGKVLRKALNESATFVIDKARPLIPAVSGRARKSLKARSSQDAVRVVVGGKAAPYYPWLDYGGSVGVNDSAHRPFISEGRYLYPTLGKHRDEFERILTDALADVARQAGVETD
jgi:hypothetical protein